MKGDKVETMLTCFCGGQKWQIGTSDTECLACHFTFASIYLREYKIPELNDKIKEMNKDKIPKVQ